MFVTLTWPLLVKLFYCYCLTMRHCLDTQWFASFFMDKSAYNCIIIWLFVGAWETYKIICPHLWTLKYPLNKTLCLLLQMWYATGRQSFGPLCKLLLFIIYQLPVALCMGKYILCGSHSPTVKWLKKKFLGSDAI